MKHFDRTPRSFELAFRSLFIAGIEVEGFVRNNDRMREASDVNPYQPTHVDARPLFEPVWKLSSSANSVIEFEWLLDKEQYRSCLRDNPSPIRNSRGLCFFSVFLLVLNLFFLSIAFAPRVKSPLDDIGLWLMLSVVFSAGMLIYHLPKSIAALQVRQVMRSTPWLFGNVKVRCEEEDFVWCNEAVELRLSWDSLNAIHIEGSVVWLTFAAPVSMLFPIHRDAMGGSLFESLVDGLKLHPRFVLALRLHTSRRYDKKVNFEKYGAPWIASVPAGGVAFRSSEDTSLGSISLSFISFILWHLVFWSLVGLWFGLLDNFVPVAFVNVVKSLQTKVSVFFWLWFPLYTFLVWGLSFRPLGVRWYERMPKLSRSQAGYLAHDHVLLETPAGSWKLWIGKAVRVERDENCLRLKLLGRNRDAFVVPCSQFLDADWQRVDRMLAAMG